MSPLTSSIDALRSAAVPLRGADSDLDPLLQRIGDASVVLLGEGSHGTREFYRERARITRRLIAEKGFCAVAIEGDWPDAYRVHRYVTASSADATASKALAGFRRFPTWMWRNREVVNFVDWLRAYNHHRPPAAQPVGFYGLDLYSLHASMDAVIGYLDQVDSAAAALARERYGCFDQFGSDTRHYGLVARAGLDANCAREVMAQLVALRERASDYLQRDGLAAEDAQFSAEQNARLVRNAEAYYRSMFLEEVSSWNLRDQHMMETLEQLLRHLRGRTPQAKVVVWAHNSHVGDARATELGESGELNIGQLARQRYDGGAVLVGFTTYHGTVSAASYWDGPTERKQVRPALIDSYEAVFHTLGLPRFLLIMQPDERATSALIEPRLERAIGVIYRPETERQSHYFSTRLPAQFDAVVHIDETRAVEPLDKAGQWPSDEVPETFPFAV